MSPDPSLQAPIRISLHKPTQGATLSAMRKKLAIRAREPHLTEIIGISSRRRWLRDASCSRRNKGDRRGSDLPHRHCARYRTALATPVECRHTASAKKRERCRDRTLSGVQSAGINRASVFRMPSLAVPRLRSRVDHRGARADVRAAKESELESP